MPTVGLPPCVPWLHTVALNAMGEPGIEVGAAVPEVTEKSGALPTPIRFPVFASLVLISSATAWLALAIAPSQYAPVETEVEAVPVSVVHAPGASDGAESCTT